jgi:hypothetical protein
MITRTNRAGERTRRWFWALASTAVRWLSKICSPKRVWPLKTPCATVSGAKRVIFLYMAGGPWQLETVYYKPQLAKFNGTLPPADLLKGYRAAFINPNSTLLGPKFKFAKYGNNGAELSELLPHLATIVDDIAIVKSMTTDAFNHAPGQLLMNTGTLQFGRPSIGSWATYGLGSESHDLPAFIVFSSGKKGPSGGNSCWGSGFLPTVYQGVQFRGSGDRYYIYRIPKASTHNCNATRSIPSKAESHAPGCGWRSRNATRVNSFEIAYRMQTAPRN